MNLKINYYENNPDTAQLYCPIRNFFIWPSRFGSLALDKAFFSWAYLDNNSIWKLPTLVKRGHIKQLGTGHWKNEHSDDLVRPPQMHGYHPPVTRVPKKPRDGPIWNPTSNRHYYCEVCSFKLGHSSMNLRGFVCISS